MLTYRLGFRMNEGRYKNFSTNEKPDQLVAGYSPFFPGQDHKAAYRRGAIGLDGRTAWYIPAS